MKGRFFNFTLALMILIISNACNKHVTITSDDPTGEITIDLAISDEKTKGVPDAGFENNDTYVHYVDIFVFGKVSGNMEWHERIVAPTTNVKCTVRVAVGEKVVYAVANAHDIDISAITTLTEFQEQESDLLLENYADFVMVGRGEGTVSKNGNIDIPITVTRHISRIELKSISVNFVNTGYSTQKLTDVKIYLINVPRKVSLHNGGAIQNCEILNDGRYTMGQGDQPVMTGMLRDELASGAGIGPGSQHTTKHYFHCYPNIVDANTPDSKITKLVIEGKINSESCYYPIPINTEHYCSLTGGTTKGIDKNTWYSLSVNILKKGSSGPNTELEQGSISVTISATGWTVHDCGEITF